VNSGVSTGNTVEVVISFENQPLKSLNNNAFEELLASATLTDEVSVRIKGTVDVTARTEIGDVPISGIPVDVTSSLKGAATFNHQVGLNNISVIGSGGQGGNEYVIGQAIATLENPSNVSLSTVDVSLAVIFEGTQIGRAVMNVSCVCAYGDDGN